MKRFYFIGLALGGCLLLGSAVYAASPVASISHTGQAAAKKAPAPTQQPEQQPDRQADMQAAEQSTDRVNNHSNSAPVNQGRPVAVMAERTYTFDAVPEGTEVRHDFVIENHGSAPLRIIKVKTG